MSKQVFIPKLGQTVEEVTLLRWLADEGARVEEGQGILEVETDKANFTVEATAAGYLHRGPFSEGQVLPVLAVVAVIGKEDERFEPGPGAPAPPSRAEPAPTETSAQQAGAPVEPTERLFASPRARMLAARKNVDLSGVKPTGDEGRRIVERDVLAYLKQAPRATPLAERMASAAGVDWRAVPGTGPGGRVTKGDVAAAAPAAQAPAGPRAESPEVLERVPLRGVRAIIAERMGQSVHTTARVTLFMEADATELVAMRERLKARVEKEWGFAPGYNDLIAKMVATALRRFPYMNARLTADSIERLAAVNIGMATDTERGLLVPVIRDADKKSLREFGTEFRALVERARSGKALPDDLTGGTFTLTNLGMYDVDAFTPVINLPEAAILGLGRIAPQPVAREGQVVIRQMLILSLVFDHRLVDGAPAARFLQFLKDLIEEPYLWIAS